MVHNEKDFRKLICDIYKMFHFMINSDDVDFVKNCKMSLYEMINDVCSYKIKRILENKNKSV